MMIHQGLSERLGEGGIEAAELQDYYLDIPSGLSCIESRIYCEIPSNNFRPSPGLLQYVSFPEEDWLRIDGWVCHYFISPVVNSDFRYRL